jgi:sulfite reductase (NADPH) flavoprotein alpha-component
LLFFGHQRSNYDFFYEGEFKTMKEQGQLKRLALAWSRDGDQKIYVQDRMREVGRDLWSWLADGAHNYVCGDAKRMAKDVEIALVDVVAQHGARKPGEAAAFVGDLKKKAVICMTSIDAGRRHLLFATGVGPSCPAA